MKGIRVIDLEDGEKLLFDYRFIKGYFNESELLLLKEKVQASIEFCRLNDVEKLNQIKIDKNHKWLSDEMDRANFESRLAPKKIRRGFVYLIRDNSNQFIKIGFSANPSVREKTLMSEKPDLTLIFKIEASMTFEKLIQKSFEPYRVRGEWYKIKPDEVIQEIMKFENRII